jgi:hypothetical protein
MSLKAETFIRARRDMTEYSIGILLGFNSLTTL